MSDLVESARYKKERNMPTLLEQVEALRGGNRRHKLPPGECPYCDREREQGVSFHPSHDASESCKSGKHPHCTCDSCF
jgi:hypothetical protein